MFLKLLCSWTQSGLPMLLFVLVFRWCQFDNNLLVWNWILFESAGDDVGFVYCWENLVLLGFIVMNDMHFNGFSGLTKMYCYYEWLF